MPDGKASRVRISKKGKQRKLEKKKKRIKVINILKFEKGKKL